MNWQPIETFDALKRKPAHAVFYFKGTPPHRGNLGKYGLYPTIQLTRNFGVRECVFWVELPPLPEQA